MSRLTNTQVVILSSASRRNDRGVNLPANVTDEAVPKAVDKLIRAGLLEEVRANGSLLAWRRDAEAGPMALRITRQGLEAVGVKDDALGAPTEAGVRPASTHKVDAPARKAMASRKRRSVVAETPAREKHRPGKAEIKAGSKSSQAAAGDPTKAEPGSKQSRLLAMLQSPTGATIAAMMKATGWQQHSVRGFLAGVIRKRLKLRLGSNKTDGVRVYQIASRRRSGHR
jgi:Protein of unknown function (DUF3489)